MKKPVYLSLIKELTLEIKAEKYSFKKKLLIALIMNFLEN